MRILLYIAISLSVYLPCRLEAQSVKVKRINFDSLERVDFYHIKKSVSQEIDRHSYISDSLKNSIIYYAAYSAYSSSNYKLCDSVSRYFIPTLERDQDTMHLLLVGSLQSRSFNRLGNYADEIECLIKYKRVADNYGEPKFIIEYNRRFSWLNFYIGNLDRALEYTTYLDTLIGEEGKDFARFSNLLASIYQKDGYIAKALPYYHRAVEVAGQLNLGASEAVYLSNRAAAYLELDSLTKAEDDISSAVEHNRQTGNWHQFSGNMAIWSRILEAQGNIEKAIRFVESGLKKGKEVESYRGIRRSYKELYRYHKQVGNYKKAFGYLDTLYHDYNDFEDNKRLNDILTKVYDTELSLQKNKLNLLASERQFDVLIIEQQKKNQLYFIFGSIIILGILSLYFYRHQLLMVLESSNREQLYEKEIIEVEMKALRSQMNPHFLFNSLNSIKNYIVKNEVREATKYLNKFSKLMRLILNHSKERFIPISEELKALSIYMDLEQMRFSERFEYYISIDENVNDQAIVPPMTLQPFIENSVWHAFNGVKRTGIISINIRKDSGYLLIEILDDGIGRKAAENMKTMNVKAHKGMGVEITTHRIESLKIGDLQGSVGIYDRSDSNFSGTRVIVKIPYVLDIYEMA